MNNLALHRFSLTLAVCTLILVAAGASVTSNDAGLSVPDWPLSYGKLMPEMVGGVIYEHGHRMIAAAVGFLTIVLAIWLWRVESRRWLKRLGWAAVGAVIAQGVLGGLTVLLSLPKAVSIGHACLAQLFFSATVAMALFTSPSWREGPRMVEDQGWPPMRALAWLAPVLVLAQLVLGAAYRHRALGLMPHVVGAILAGGFLVLVSVFVLTQYGGHKALQRAARTLLLLTLVQVVLGIAAYLSRISTVESLRPMLVMVIFTVLHVAVGALTMAWSVVLAIEILRNVRQPLESPAGGAAAVS